MITVYVTTLKDRKAQKVRNWTRRRAVRRGDRRQDYATSRRRFVMDGRIDFKATY